jgi:hypothetical protein
VTELAACWIVSQGAVKLPELPSLPVFETYKVEPDWAESEIELNAARMKHSFPREVMTKLLSHGSCVEQDDGGERDVAGAPGESNCGTG